MNQVVTKVMTKVGQAFLYGISGYEVAQITSDKVQEKVIVNIPTPRSIVSQEDEGDVDFGLISLFIIIAILFAGLVIFALKYYIKKQTREAPVNLNLS